MSLRIANLTKRLFRRFTRKAASPPITRARLNVTALEDRTVPTPVITVINLADTVEGGSAGALRFTRTETAGSLTVNYDIGGTAFPGGDYTPIGTQVTFADGSATADVSVTALVDNLVEGNEAVAVIVLPYYNYMVGSPNSASVIIADNPPVVSVETFSHAWEGGASGMFRFTRSGGDLSQPMTVNYSVTGTAAPGSDYTMLSGTVTFAANVDTVDVLVVPVDDALADPNEAVTVTIQPYYPYTIGTPNSATAMIVDNDTPLVTVGKIADGIEGGANGALRFTRTGNTTGSLTVNYTVSGTATSGTDFTALPGTVSIAAGSATADVTVAVTNDALAESTETVLVSVVGTSSYQADPNAIDVVNIADDDTNPGVIGGTVWNDDGDGIKEVGELPAVGSPVTLRDQAANRLFETVTDATGAYQFRGLPVGTYFVDFRPPLLYWYAPANQGLDEAADSDADTQTGDSGLISLTTGAMTNLLVGAGFVLTAAPNIPDLSMVFTYRDGTPLGADNYLKVAKWGERTWPPESKWVSVFEDDPAPANQALPAAKRMPRLSSPNAQGFDFIDRDEDRFNVRVRDDANWNKKKPDGVTPDAPTIDVTIKTSNTGNAGYDDGITTLRLNRIPDHPGMYWSDSQLLVSNDTDDKREDAAYLGTDEAAPSANKNKKGFFITDRTHKIALGGTVTAKYGTIEKSATVKVEKTVKLHVTILKTAAGGQPTITVAKVQEDIARTQEIYAQAGIKIELALETGETLADRVKDPPTGVNLANGLSQWTMHEQNPAPPFNFTDKYKLTDEEKALFDAPFRTGTAAGKNDIEVYYVNFLALDGKKSDVRGESFPSPFVSNANYAHSVIIGGDNRKYMTLAHEVMHILGVYPHHTVVPNQVGPLDRVNLLIGPEVPMSVNVDRIIATGTEVIDSRRATPEQETKILSTEASLLH